MSERRPRPSRPGVPELAIVVVLALLIAGGLLFGGGSPEPERTVVAPERLARVVAEVEQIRGLAFRRPVAVEVMEAEEVAAYAASRTKEGELREVVVGGELMKLLGLVEPGYDFSTFTTDLFGGQVAGFYDTEEERLVLVEDVGIDDATLAHELTHALEDQHFDLAELGVAKGTVTDDDAAGAETGLVEGTASLVMTRYMERNPDAVSLGDALGQLLSATDGRPLPPAVMRSLVFPYTTGESFARRLHDVTGDWRLLDNALRHRPPRASADLIDPDRWLRLRRPERVALPAADAPGPGWRRVKQTTAGEYDLRELLRDAHGSGRAQELAATWTGGALTLWSRGTLPVAGCASPCRGRTALALRWRVDSPAAARRLASALRAWLRETLDAEPAAGTMRIGPDSVAAVAHEGRQVRVAMAPDTALLARLLR